MGASIALSDSALGVTNMTDELEADESENDA
jgi:hypothetical protein